MIAAAGERYSKVAAEALRVCEELVHVIRPVASHAVPSALKVCHQSPGLPVLPRVFGTGLQGPQCALQAAVAPLVRCVKERLGAPDQDQEVKECAISYAAAVAAVLGPDLKKELPGLLKVFSLLFHARL